MLEQITQENVSKLLALYLSRSLMKRAGAIAISYINFHPHIFSNRNNASRNGRVRSGKGAQCIYVNARERITS